MFSKQHMPNAEDERSLDDLWADINWKQAVNRDLMELNKSLRKIKSESHRGYSVRKISKKDTSFATAKSDGLGGLKTCLRIVKSTRLATVQCLWLSVCTIVFSYFVIFHCLRVNSSHSADFKPQKKSRIVNFASDWGDYQMPNFSLIVSSSMDERGFLNDLSEMVDTSEFECHYYFDLNNNSVFGLTGPIRIYSNKRYKNLRQQWITISPENPKSGSGPWYCAWRFKAKNFNQALFFVSRNTDDISAGSFKSMHLSFLPHETAVVSFDYSENVIERYEDGTIIHGFFSSINEMYRPSDPDANFNVEVFITMHPEVSYWQEYRNYTPEDALSSLGGLLTLISIVYFWVAYYIAVYLGRHSYEMGILPEMSFVFSNLEKILLIKECLEENNLIPPTSRWFGRGINTYYGELEISKEVSKLSVFQEGINSYDGQLEISKEVSRLAISRGKTQKNYLGVVGGEL